MASASQHISSASVETMLLPMKGARQVAQIAAGSHGRAGSSRRPMPSTQSPVTTNASAPGSRAAHSFWPRTATLAAIDQYTIGGLVRCGRSPSSVGSSQSPLSSMLSAVAV